MVFCLEGSTVTFVRMQHKCIYSILIFTTVQYNKYTTMHSIVSPDERLAGMLQLNNVPVGG